METKVGNLTVAKANEAKTRKRIKEKEKMIRIIRTRLCLPWESKETIMSSIVSNVETPNILQENARSQGRSAALCIEVPRVMTVKPATLGGRPTRCRLHPPDHLQEKE